MITFDGFEVCGCPDQYTPVSSVYFTVDTEDEAEELLELTSDCKTTAVISKRDLTKGLQHSVT